jgi:hypothetical protein
MDRERERAARVLAEERERIQPRLKAERSRIDRHRESLELDAKHRDIYGPKVVTGPDGIAVHLEVVTNGVNNWRNPPPFLRGPNGTPTWGHMNEGYRLVQRRGFLLRIGWPSGHHRIFVRDEDAAAALFARAVREVEHSGFAGLRTWTTPKGQR